MIREIGANPKNFNKGTISFRSSLLNEMKSGKVTKLKVFNNQTMVYHPELIDAEFVVQNISQISDYFVAPFIKPMAPAIFTQAQVAKAWGVRACRLSELNRAGLLVADGKSGRNLTYSQALLEKAIQNPIIVTWINNTRKVDKA